MTPGLLSTAYRRARDVEGRRVCALLALASAIALFRTGMIGNPIDGLDEHFYLMVGDRMWHGEMPYVDIWDRKPFGLFLILAAVRLLPGDGVTAAYVVAGLCVAATAAGIVVLARRSVALMPATMAGIFYVAALNELGGQVWQTPVFYNLLIVVAAILTLRATASPKRHRGRVAAAMALAGLAIQIKTSAVFQGAFLGMWLVAARWRETRDWRSVWAMAARMIAIAAAPTLAVIALYAAMGQFAAWWQANILSVMTKAPATALSTGMTLGPSLIRFAPVLLLTILGFWARTKRFGEWTIDTAFFAGWIALAVVDFFALGGYYDHYTLPLLAAACPVIAHAFALRRYGPAIFAVALAWPVVHATIHTPRLRARDAQVAAQVMAHMPPAVRRRCLFIYEGPVAYYRLAQACRVTRFAFPAHLSSMREAPSLGVDPLRELDTIMARRPAAVLTVEHLYWPDRNLAMERRLARYLARNYLLRARVSRRFYSTDENVLIWERRT